MTALHHGAVNGDPAVIRVLVKGRLPGRTKLFIEAAAPFKGSVYRGRNKNRVETSLLFSSFFHLASLTSHKSSKKSSN